MASRSNKNMMKRSCRVYLNDANANKVGVLTGFLAKCHDVQQFFVDHFWQQKDFTGKFADLPTVHKAVNRFGVTTRLSQALAKQAKETIKSQVKVKQRKPRLRRHTATLFYHFVTVQKFSGKGFDWCVKFIGSGAPKMTVPFKSTKLINRRIDDGWTVSDTIRLGRDGKRLWVDLILEKLRPKPKQHGKIVGMDSNYKAGFVFSNGIEHVGQKIYERIQQFKKRQKNTYAEIDSMVGHALKKVDWQAIKTLSIENLKSVKQGKRGTFRREMNRRLSHWLYKASELRIERICEENGISLVFKDPWKTSQTCRACLKWDKRNRKGDKFKCVNCGHEAHSDYNSADNLEYLAVAGIYGFRSPRSEKCKSFS